MWNLGLSLLCALSALSLAACHSDAPGKILTTEEAQHAQQAYHETPLRPWHDASAADIPTGPAGDQVRYGIALLTQTSQLIGPRASDPNKRFCSNNLNCSNCHQAGPSGLPGTKPYVLPYVNVAHEYPKFDAKSMRMLTLEERIIGMMGHGAVTPTSHTSEIVAITAYFEWLGQHGKTAQRMQGTGLPALAFPPRAANLEAGRALFAGRCAPCHGDAGLGRQRDNYARGGGYVIPPIAGDDSYDDGGHMYMVPLFARFIYATMPPGANHAAPLLQPGEALDIAAYVNSALPRQHAPGRVDAYPNGAFRAPGFAIPEHYLHNEAGFQRAKYGPYTNLGE